MNRSVFPALLWTALSAAACGDATTPLEGVDVPVADDTPSVDVPMADAPVVADATASRDAALDRPTAVADALAPDVPRPPVDAGGLRDVAADRGSV